MTDTVLLADYKALGLVVIGWPDQAHVDRCVHIDEPCIVVGWRIGVSGRKYEVGTALFDYDGDLCARARALWIEPRPAGGIVRQV